MPDRFLPIIELLFDAQKDCQYEELVRKALSNILPDGAHEAIYDWLEKHLPLVTIKHSQELPGNISFLAFSKLQSNSFKFFYDMLNNWLLPGKRLNVLMVYAIDFRLPEINEDIYTLSEMIIRVKNVSEMKQIVRSFSLMESEMRLGISSSYQSRHILEVKGLTPSEKIALIQSDMTYLIEKKPKTFQQDLLIEMQSLMVSCSEEFKASRSCRYLSRIAIFHYLLRKAVQRGVQETLQKRHLILKISRARVKLEGSLKSVLSIMVCVNFFNEQERLEENHFFKAVKDQIPFAIAVKNSFFFHCRGNDAICTLYMEVGKEDGKNFTGEEVAHLRRRLPKDLKARIHHFMHPIFMPRNEEEVMRNIVSLSNQIRYLRDIPQVCINFDEQTSRNIHFTVIVVRLLKNGSPSVGEMFRKTNTCLEYIHDSCQNAGKVRSQHKKEATVFKVKLSKDLFLREDQSLDINLARQMVANELRGILGEFRDFNGGMISKQNEIFAKLKELLKDSEYEPLILDNFFYSITPAIMRNLLEPRILQSTFNLIVEVIKADERPYSFNVLNDEFGLSVVVKTDDSAMKEEIHGALSRLSIPSYQLASFRVMIYENLYLGYIYRVKDREFQQKFCQTIKNLLGKKTKEI